MPLSARGAVEGGRVTRSSRVAREPGDTVAEVPLTGLSFDTFYTFYTFLTETCRSPFRTLSYPQILLKTPFKIGERQVSHLSLAQIA